MRCINRQWMFFILSMSCLGLSGCLMTSADYSNAFPPGEKFKHVYYLDTSRMDLDYYMAGTEKPFSFNPTNSPSVFINRTPENNVGNRLVLMKRKSCSCPLNYITAIGAVTLFIFPAALETSYSVEFEVYEYTSGKGYVFQKKFQYEVSEIGVLWLPLLPFSKGGEMNREEQEKSLTKVLEQFFYDVETQTEMP